MVRKREKAEGLEVERPKRSKLSAKESLKRMREFAKRRGQFIAAVRNSRKP